jgi:hypothetical protein
MRSRELCTISLFGGPANLAKRSRSFASPAHAGFALVGEV